MIKKFKIIFALIILFLNNCSTGYKLLRDANPGLLNQLENIVYPEIRFLVISDPHIFESSYKNEGPVLNSFLENNAKMIGESVNIMEAFMDEIENVSADFVLVCGDLTNQGEKISHEIMAGFLSEIENSGKKVFVVPGNHDILNSRAVRYLSDREESAETITPDDFKNIYSNFGYNEALIQDPDSLSYVTEPVEGLWLLGMDSCMYRENINSGKPLTGGSFYPETLKWITEVLKQAIIKEKAVIGFMHHGILEHYTGQSRYYEDFIIRDYERISRLFALYGMKLVFTGHFHAQDIVIKTWEDNEFLIDIETGSFVSYPCPYRIIEINNEQIMQISSNYITEISGYEHGFPEYAFKHKYNRITEIVSSVVTRYCVSDEDALYISCIIADAAMAHFAGDENRESEIIDYGRISSWAGFVIDRRKRLLQALWNDLWPADNNITINLNNLNEIRQ